MTVEKAVSPWTYLPKTLQKASCQWTWETCLPSQQNVTESFQSLRFMRFLWRLYFHLPSCLEENEDNSESKTFYPGLLFYFIFLLLLGLWFWVFLMHLHPQSKLELLKCGH